MAPTGSFYVTNPKELQVSGEQPQNGETYSETETDARREKILKQMLGSKPEPQEAVADKARRRRQSK